MQQLVEVIICKCGCRESLNKYDQRNRVRSAIWGHLSINNLIFFEKGQTPWSKGKKMSIESRKKMSVAQTGKKLSLEHRMKLSQNNAKYWLGKPRLDQRGPNNNLWTGHNSHTERERAMETLAYKNWRRAVFERDDYICRFCDQHGRYLQADHIKPWALFPELRYEVDNGQTLCKKCHAIKTKADKKIYTEYVKINKTINK